MEKGTNPPSPGPVRAKNLDLKNPVTDVLRFIVFV